ncbi:uncharacterized protein MELLADRAFT_117405 [Melampsora larici-populina 98AG31]|uniref:Uncharacterized protein n=1 Tax=Melampsora larici-populina (strain 98AG31 / pathotype 3-4-7) TaxID=747676 RepID=F4RWS5_MELLP|nr:uncharacterized protein MELLADRAFT_117405 [Melampsora larici-populina 98AG31]EGG03176.1 hypothetical protein MELLADRAFT_117405 [Melampsora larici-populina 98AG31]
MTNTSTTTTTTTTTEKKQCFTKGLMDRLKARSKMVRSVGHQSKLPIFIWESPPLGTLYRITFLARLEDDGEEGLGFRFDDTLSEVPRRLVWGGTVGTTESPGRFLNGSQTFLTDSASKASDRCRKGWHVRIGKVSEVLKAFEDVEDSLVMKVSLRKLDPSTQLTNLTTADSNPTTIPHPALHSTKSQTRRPLPLTPVVSAVNSTAQPTPPQTPSKTIDQAPPLPPKTPQIAVHSPIPKPPVKSIPSSTPPNSNPSIDKPAVPAPASPPFTPSLQKSNDIPTEVLADTSVTPEITASPPVETPSPELSPDVASEPIAVTEEIPVLQSESSPTLEPDTTPAAPTEDQAESVNPVDVQSSTDIVAFVFPNRTGRSPKKVYIKLELLQGIEHFKKLLEGSAAESEIPSRYPPFRALVITITEMFGSLIGPWMNRVNCRAEALLARFPTIGRIFRFTQEYLMPSMTRVLIGLFKLIGSGVELILEELITLVENIMNPKDQDLMFEIHLRIWKGLRAFLLRSEEWDEEEDIESFCEDNEGYEMTNNREIQRMIVINDAAYSTYKALADYLEHRTVNFAPLRSKFECQKALLISTVGLGSFPPDYRSYLHSRLNGQACCDARKLYKLSNELKINELNGLAQEYLMKNINQSNVRYEFKKAKEMKLEKICESYIKFMELDEGY